MKIPEIPGQPSVEPMGNGGRKRVSAALFSKLLIDAMDVGNVHWVLRQLAEIESRLSEKGTVLDFDRCDGIRQMVQETRARLTMCGRREEAEELAKAFGKYFLLDTQG